MDHSQKRHWSILIALLLFCMYSQAQDSIPPSVTVDSLAVDSLPPPIVDTIVIREVQSKIKIVPRGVVLSNPWISFADTKPITERKKKFVIPSFWEKVNKVSFILNEAAFVNWNAGGDNSVSAIGRLDFERNYKFRHVKWDNVLALRYGWNTQEGRGPRKTEDAIRLRSTFGYQRDTLSPWYFSVKGKFNTQFTDGFDYPDRGYTYIPFYGAGLPVFRSGYFLYSKRFRFQFVYVSGLI